MNTTKLRYAIAVDHYGSMSAAARQVHISQSSLTKSIAELEQELGFPLFIRHSRGVTATPEGRQFIDRASRIVADFDRLRSDAKARRNIKESLLRIVVCPPPMVTLLNPALPDTLARNAEVEVEVLSASTARAMTMLRAGDADLLIGPERPIVGEGEFKVIPLPPFSSFFFAARNHPLSRKRRISADDIKPFPLVLVERQGASIEFVDRLFGGHRLPPDQMVHTVGHFPLTCEIVAKTPAIGLAGEAYRTNKEFLKRFAVLPISLGEPSKVCACYRNGDDLSAVARALVSAMGGATL